MDQDLTLREALRDLRVVLAGRGLIRGRIRLRSACRRCAFCHLTVDKSCLACFRRLSPTTPTGGGGHALTGAE